MNPFIVIPLFYQLIQAYKPIYSSPKITYTQNVDIAKPTPLLSPSPTPTPAPLAKTTVTPQNIGSISGRKLIRIAVLGDSMVQTLGTNIYPLKKSLQQYFSENTFFIRNFGQPSSNIEAGLKVLNDTIIKEEPDIIVIESFAYNNFGNTQAGIDRQWLDLGALTSTINTKLPNTKIVIAATIAPNSVTFANGTENKFTALDKIEKSTTIKNYLKNAISFAKSQGFPLANAYELSLDNNDGNREFIDSVDNIHPSELGSQLFCETIAKAIYDNKLIP